MYPINPPELLLNRITSIIHSPHSPSPNLWLFNRHIVDCTIINWRNCIVMWSVSMSAVFTMCKFTFHKLLPVNPSAHRHNCVPHTRIIYLPRNLCCQQEVREYGVVERRILWRHLTRGVNVQTASEGRHKCTVKYFLASSTLTTPLVPSVHSLHNHHHHPPLDKWLTRTHRDRHHARTILMWPFRRFPTIIRTLNRTRRDARH